MVIVADTGPILYLFLVGQIDLLPSLYGIIAVPAAVAAELSHRHTPSELRLWFAGHPSWLQIHATPALSMPWPNLDIGEREALELAVQLHADLILTDDSAGRQAARAIANLRAIGTIGVLYQGALEHRLTNSPNMASAFDNAIARLHTTNFFFTSKLDAAITALSSRLHQQEEPAS